MESPLNFRQLQIMTEVLEVHAHDPNFPYPVLVKIREFLGMCAFPRSLAVVKTLIIRITDNKDIFETPEQHQQIIAEVSVEAALIKTNSPYAEVRGVVDNTDNPSMPCSTIRAWVIATFLAIGISALDQVE
jgi:hypothetical protein